MENTLDSLPRWSMPAKISFRFFISFFLISIIPFPLNVADITGKIDEWYSMLWDPFIPWVGQHILHIGYPITVKPNGSGDTTYNYVQMVVYVVMAVLACIVWSVIDRKRKNYSSLSYWATLLVRYYLAYVMMSYGFYKIFKLQFPFPYLGGLNEQVGQMSPMGLAWTFMGYSVGFNFFTGFFEALAGFLLFFRRTTTFGALMCITVMSNIVMINFCYDVPVKLFSSMLLMMAMFIAAMDLRRIVDFFFRNKTVEAVNMAPVVKKRWMKITRLVLKVVLIGYLLYSNISGALEIQKTYGDAAPKPPLYGIYKVETFIANHDTLAPLTTDSMRWSTLMISFAGNASIRRMNDSSKYYSFKPDTAKKLITMYPYSDTTKKYLLSYSTPDTSHLVLCGLLKDDSVCISMNRINEKNFMLVKRGFHWINEYPYNR